MGEQRSAARMLRVGVTIASAGLLAGCPTPVPQFPAGGTTEDDGTTGDPADTTMRTATDPADTTRATTADDGAPTTAMDGTDDGPPAEGARVVFVAGTAIDLGEIDPGSNALVGPLVLRNQGTTAATQLSAPDLGPPLAWAGGTFPGTGGTCGESLSRGQACEIVLAAVPGVVGVSGYELEITYQDGATTETASTLLEMLVVGTTDDLVMNGGFERGGEGELPPGWTATAGGWTAVSTQAYEGEQSAFPGIGGFGEALALEQTVALEPWAETIAMHGMTLQVDGAARALNILGDQWRVELSEINEKGGAEVVWQTPASGSTNWTPFGYLGTLAPTTRAVRIELRCLASSGMACDAWFDAIEAFVSYP